MVRLLDEGSQLLVEKFVCQISFYSSKRSQSPSKTGLSSSCDVDLFEVIRDSNLLAKGRDRSLVWKWS